MSNFELFPTTRTLRVVTSAVAPEVEADWNTWYNTKHLPDLLSVPGYISGRRFRRLDKPHSYISIWELTDPDVIFSKELDRVKGNGIFSDHVTASGVSFEEIARLASKD